MTRKNNTSLNYEWSKYQKDIFDYIEHGQGHLVVEADAVGLGEGDGDADLGRLAVAKAGSGAQAVDACIGSVHVDCPRIGALYPARGMEDTAFEGFHWVGAYIEGVDCVIA